ncbi:acetyl-CoA carboxylase biotin carboxylase subunit [Billgrantia endophytica]|uniref:Biotin carboxylase n=1 Tax=Billgrantia endophytica TaxID=2033802 RepID=A0A2N7TX58_9GAMM|nr:acetyl-CoA carboxylase biotin carboxylase subunit [Halomonas endophytica]PMR72760.1 acetyl-CoA carboxylase biotin carboxylase subunit [Halomonas endophytica]
MKRVLVANRGEIALRIIRACRKAGMESVAVYSEADRNSPHVWAADDAVCIGPPPSAESYLRSDRLLLAAKATGADAIHPGYGFLAENAGFARACADAGIIFIGPSAEMIDLMGDKVKARQAAVRAGVRVVPGTEGGYGLAELPEAFARMEEIGFPLLLKAVAGGGGRGMRVVRAAENFEREFIQAAREAEAAFGDGTVYMERYFDKARHIEVQVLSDRHGQHIHLGERDCTIQRRHQKLIEESPSPVLSDAERKEVCDMAVALTSTMNYENAGTVEFLYDVVNGGFFFIEMNTRIQVEHPVTEMVTGVDIVYEQLRIASGEYLEAMKSEREWAHAIEWRINAEDASRGFLPSPGMVTTWDCPRSKAVRLDSHVYPWYVVPTFYDSLLGKLIVGGRTREEALARSRRVLASFQVQGVATTVPFYLLLMEQPEFQSGDVYTRWVDDNIGRLYDWAQAS